VQFIENPEEEALSPTSSIDHIKSSKSGSDKAKRVELLTSAGFNELFWRAGTQILSYIALVLP
jgi:hypothetical protein